MTPRFLTDRVLLCLAVAPSWLGAQGMIVGQVIDKDTREPVPGVQVTIAKLSRGAVSDSAGRFRLSDLPMGDHIVGLRALGFRPDSVLVELDRDEVAVRDFFLTRQAQTLPEQRVTGTETFKGKLAGFQERQKFGIGHFVTRDQLARWDASGQTANVFSRIPGVDLVRGGSAAWIASTRGLAKRVPGNADRLRGARTACYMDVYLDGALVFNGAQASFGLFDVNSVSPSSIEAIEVYTGAAQVPAAYNKTGTVCGVMLIWTRI